MKLLIDGDILLYECSSATEFACEWNDDVWILSANYEQSRDMAIEYIRTLEKRFNTDDLLFALSDSRNFRKDINPEYKSFRKKTRKPVVYGALKYWLVENYKTVTWPKLEADDVLGILHTHLKEPTVIVSIDKDMKTVPGALYKDGELLEITPEEAEYNHMLQTLTGDPTDGYGGCKGCGPVTAAKWLSSKPYWERVKQAYSKAGQTEEDALLNARMAYILQAGNWDFEKQEVKLWEPK